MKRATAATWAEQNLHDGDRIRLFGVVADAIDARTVLYPGSYADVAPSTAFDSVTYLDTDSRAATFFDDTAGVAEIVTAHGGPPHPEITFHHADYTTRLDLPDGHFDLLVSLYAGFVSEHCTRYLRVGGTLLVNPSHGDVAMASIDPRHDLTGVVWSRAGDYRVATTDLDTYLVPKKPQAITIDGLHDWGRGIAYTRSPFAYLFTRTR